MMLSAGRIIRTAAIAWALLLFGGAVGWASGPSEQPCPPASPFPCLFPSPASHTTERPTVVRINFSDQAGLRVLTGWLDVWEVHREQGYVIALATLDEQARLRELGYTIQPDPTLTAQLPVPGAAAAGADGGIPGFACYRTVEETYADLAQLAADHPNLAVWLDIGDSYDKIVPGDSPGYDLRALVLTNQASSVAKGRLVILAALHARELTTAELATRFAELLVDQYGVDPDITWLLDYNEVHIIPQGNPDGRKWAEQGYWWRKNTDRPDMCAFPNYGVDLNRNSSFLWNVCGGGCSSSDPCSIVYRGPQPASEPETQAIQDYLREVFPDQRGADLSDPAPGNATGVFLSLHSYGRLVIYPWDWTGSPAPNMDALRRLGRKLGFYNRYGVCNTSNCLYAIDGSTTDFVYGEFGVPAYTFELGTAFFENCTNFEGEVLQKNLDSLLYALKAARRPYMTPAGPDSVNVTATPRQVARGHPVFLQAAVDDSRFFSNGYGTEPFQTIAGARYTVDAPSWTGATATSLAPTDGAFDSWVEPVEGIVDTTDWAPGRHTIFVEGQDVDGNWGPPSAVFVWITEEARLSLREEPASAFAVAGQPVTYTLTVTNTGSITSTYGLFIKSDWEVTIPESDWNLAPGESETIPIIVQTPLSVKVGSHHVTIVAVTSRSDLAVYGVATFETLIVGESQPETETGSRIFLPWIAN